MDCIKDLQAAIRNILVNNGLTVYVIIVDGYRVPKTAGFDLNGNALIFKADLQYRVFVRLTVPVIPDDVSGIVQFVGHTSEMN